jgi:hypothetical protein
VTGASDKVGGDWTSSGSGRSERNIWLGQNENIGLSAIRPAFVLALLKWLTQLPFYFRFSV